MVLFEGASGELEVLLTTRSSSLRTHGGQTALPGGKADPGEDNPVDTAVRLGAYLLNIVSRSQVSRSLRGDRAAAGHTRPGRPRPGSSSSRTITPPPPRRSCHRTSHRRTLSPGT